jgi:hypothetical protein
VTFDGKGFNSFIISWFLDKSGYYSIDLPPDVLNEMQLTKELLIRRHLSKESIRAEASM